MPGESEENHEISVVIAYLRDDNLPRDLATTKQVMLVG